MCLSWAASAFLTNLPTYPEGVGKDSLIMIKTKEDNLRTFLFFSFHFLRQIRFLAHFSNSSQQNIVNRAATTATK